MNETERSSWLEQRRKGLGGTDTPAIMGLNEWKGPYEVYLEKCGIVKKPIDNPYTRIGLALEPLVAELFQKEFECILVKGEFTKSDKYPWMLASPDYLYAGAKRGMDCKCVLSPFVQGKWGEEGSDQVPLAYYGQAMHYMFVFGYEVWDIGALFPDGKVHKYVIEKDPQYLELMLDHCGKFWNENVLGGIEPAPTPTRMASEYLVSRFPSNNGSMLTSCDDVTLDAVKRCAELREQIKPLESEKESCELFIKSVIGDADGLDLGDNGKITWKKTRSSIKTDWQQVVKRVAMEFKLSDIQIVQLQSIIDGCSREKEGARRLHWGYSVKP